MPRFRQVEATVFDSPRPAAARDRDVDPELSRMVSKVRTIVDESVVYEVRLEEGDDAGTIRRRLAQASKIAGVDIAVRRSPRGFFVGLLTEMRRRGRRPDSAA